MARSARLVPKLLLAALVAAGAASPALALTQDEMVSLLEEIDARQTNNGDSKVLAYVQQKEKDKADVVYELVAYRRDADDQFMILFLKPKAEAGKGYLRIDKNLFMYDPATGKWDRRTERERIGGTDSRRADYDESRLAEEFHANYVGEEKLGKFAVHHIKLDAKKDADVAYPIQHIWVDQATGNMLKAQERALSGKLMRTSYYPKWEKMFSPSKGADIYFPREIRIFALPPAPTSSFMHRPSASAGPIRSMRGSSPSAMPSRPPAREVFHSLHDSRPRRIHSPEGEARST